MGNLLLDEALFNDGPVVIFVWKNLPGWPVESVTQNLQALYQQSPADYLSGKLSYAEHIHPEDAARVFLEVSQASENPSKTNFVHEPYRYRGGDGEYHWVKDTTKIVRNAAAEVTHYVGYLIDISKDIAYESNVKRLQERLDMAWNATNDGLWDWNL